MPNGLHRIHARFMEFWHYCLTFSGSDGAVLLLGRIILLGNAFLISIYLLKKFGLGAVGTYTIANAAVTMLSMFSDLGLNYSLPREPLTNLQRNTVALVWAGLLTPVGLVLIVAYAVIMGQSQLEFWEISLLATAGFLAGLTNVANTLFIMQKRAYLSLIFPVVHTVGLLLGVIYSQTLVNFALFLLAFRALGSFIPFGLLRYARIKISKIWDCGVQGFLYLPPVILASLSEQSAPVIFSFLLSRGELGIFGLCRQVLTAGEIPCWSFLQSIYPRLVQTRLASVREFQRQNLRLSVLVAVLLLVGSFILGFFIYHLPNFFYMMILFVLIIPFKYDNCFYDQVIKSVGKIRLNIMLNVIKLIVAIPVFAIMGKTLGDWGAIIGVATIAIFSDFLYRKPGSSHFPPPPEITPQSLALSKVQVQEPLLSVMEIYAKDKVNIAG